MNPHTFFVTLRTLVYFKHMNLCEMLTKFLYHIATATEFIESTIYEGNPFTKLIFFRKDQQYVKCLHIMTSSCTGDHPVLLKSPQKAMELIWWSQQKQSSLCDSLASPWPWHIQDLAIPVGIVSKSWWKSKCHPPCTTPYSWKRIMIWMSRILINPNNDTFCFYFQFHLVLKMFREIWSTICLSGRLRIYGLWLTRRDPSTCISWWILWTSLKW